jgi:hypothetical protein
VTQRSHDIAKDVLRQRARGADPRALSLLGIVVGGGPPADPLYSAHPLSPPPPVPCGDCCERVQGRCSQPEPSGRHCRRKLTRAAAPVVNQIWSGTVSDSAGLGACAGRRPPGARYPTPGRYTAVAFPAHLTVGSRVVRRVFLTGGGGDGAGTCRAPVTAMRARRRSCA